MKKIIFAVLALTLFMVSCKKEQGLPLKASSSSDIFTKHVDGTGGVSSPFKPTTYSYVIHNGDTLRIFERIGIDSLLKWSHPANLYTRQQCADSAALIARHLVDSLIAATKASFAVGRFVSTNTMIGAPAGTVVVARSSGNGTAAQTPNGGTVLHPSADGVYTHTSILSYDPMWPMTNFYLELRWNVDANGVPTTGMVSTGVWGYGQYIGYEQTNSPLPVLTYTYDPNSGSIKLSWDVEGTYVTGGNWGIFGTSGAYGNFTNVMPFAFMGTTEYNRSYPDAGFIYTNSKYGPRIKMLDLKGQLR
jgi:hypothetical protein